MESRVAQLWQSTLLLAKFNTAPNQTVSVIKHNLISRCQAIIRDKAQNLPSKLITKSGMCLKCLSPWRDGLFHLKVKANHAPKRSLRKLLTKDPAQLTGYRKKFAQKCGRRDGNRMILVCQVCQEKTVTPLAKPEKYKVQYIETSLCSDVVDPKKKKKKRKKKARFAGLNQSFFPQSSSVVPNMKRPESMGFKLKRPADKERKLSQKKSFAVKKSKVAPINRKKLRTALASAKVMKKPSLLSNFLDSL